ncbi:MAG: hypothetical protein JO257_29290 [Deltaproteobacteria bacterium]|nr:hypothetical protein [Deltaproteobacteria bacterium]
MGVGARSLLAACSRGIAACSGLLVLLAACSGLPVLLAACSGGKPKVEDARALPHPTPPPADAAARTVDATIPPGKGDVSIRVEWHDVPLAQRAPTPCGPAVAPTTTWGIPDAVVTLARTPAATGSATTSAPSDARVTLDRCLRPRVQVAGDTLTIASAILQPTSLALDARPVLLPIAGHEVKAALTDGRHELIAGDSHAWVVRDPNAAVTDATGVAVVRDVPSGVYPVTAWLPAANLSAKGEVTVMPGALAEVTLTLKP